MTIDIVTKKHIAILCLMLAALAGILFYMSKNDIKYVRVTCQDFSNQAAAQKALKQGATYLDKNHDGQVCQNLK